MKDEFVGEEMVSLTMSRNNMRELLVVTAINTTTLDMVIHNYEDLLDPVDVLGLENALAFGVSMIESLSAVCGVSREDLKHDVMNFIDNACDEPRLQVHMNKSGEHVDDMVKLVFKNHGT